MQKYIYAAVVALLSIGVAGSASSAEAVNTYVKEPGIGRDKFKLPEGVFKMPMPPKKDVKPNTVMDSLSAEAKMKAAQTMMMFNPFSLRQMINMMVAKKKVAKGVTFDEVVESMDLRANALNMKKVGHNTPYKVIESITGKPSPRLEIISYCDVITMRLILDYSPEFSAFVPCRITVLEDANKDIWVMSLDWDVRWLDTSQNPNRISDDLRKRAIEVRKAIESIMEAGATGDL